MRGLCPSVSVSLFLWCHLHQLRVCSSVPSAFFWMLSKLGLCPSVSVCTFLWCHLHQLRVCSSVPVSTLLNVLYISEGTLSFCLCQPFSVTSSTSAESVFFCPCQYSFECPLYKLGICPSVSVFTSFWESVLLSLSVLFLGICPSFSVCTVLCLFCPLHEVGNLSLFVF